MSNTYKRQCDLKRCHLNCIFNTILKTSGVPRTPLLAVGGPQMDSGPSHNVRGPVSISGHERATSRVLAIGGHKWTQLSHNVESWVYSWPWKGYKWTQDLLTMSGVLSSLLAVGGPQVDSGPSHNVKFSVILWMWEGLYTKTAMLNVLKT